MSEPRYSHYAKDTSGWFFGLTGRQLTVVVLAGLPELAAVNARRWLLVLCWAPVWAVLTCLVVVPVRGRSAGRWLVDLTLHALGGAMGWSAWQSKAAAGLPVDPDEADLPGVLAAVRIHDGPPFGPGLTRVAIVQDTAARTWAAVARIVHPGIGLAELDARDRMAEGLAELCEISSRTDGIELFAIQVRTVPDDGAERAAWETTHRHPGAPPAARAVNDRLGAMLTPAAVRTEAFITVVVAEGRIARPARQAGGGIDGRARVLHSALRETEGRLRGPIGCTAVSWLDAAELAASIRTGFAPGDRAFLVAADLAAHHDPQVATGVPVAAAGPSRAVTEIRHYRHDAWTTVTDTVLLPEQGAILGALAPVFIPSAPGERRCVTVFFPALAAAAADRLVGREEMSATTGNALRARAGLLIRARQRRATEQVTGMDEKLARGRALVRAAAAAAVTVPGTWPAAEAGRRLDASIRAAGFIPQRLDLAQDSGFVAACIPLGIGVPRRRGWR